MISATAARLITLTPIHASNPAVNGSMAPTLCKGQSLIVLLPALATDVRRCSGLPEALAALELGLRPRHSEVAKLVVVEAGQLAARARTLAPLPERRQDAVDRTQEIVHHEILQELEHASLHGGAIA